MMRILVSVLLLIIVNIESFTTRLSKLKSKGRIDSTLLSLWKDKIDYVDLNVMIDDLNPSSTSRTLPLFLLGGAFYPAGKTSLSVFEMKYRTMMFDIAKTDDTFGYIHTDEYGRIGSVGTVCKVTDRMLFQDGRQVISFEGVTRFRITKILKTLPYVLAEVEPDIVDDVIEDEAATRKLEAEVYDSLKYYMRLMKSYSPEKNLVVSQAVKKSKPSLTGSSSDYLLRRTDFSFSLANMIQMKYATESQLLLQTTNVMKRLNAEKDILLQASELVSDHLIADQLLTADKRDSLKFQSFNDSIDDDILPPDLAEEAEKEEVDEWDIKNME